MKNKVIKIKGMASEEVVQELYERWSRRADYLKSIMYDDNETEARRKKAYNAFMPYLQALTSLFMSAMKAQTTTEPKEFEQGGRVIGTVHRNENVFNNLKHF